MYSLAVISMLLFCVCYDNYQFSLIPCFLFFFRGGHSKPRIADVLWIRIVLL